MDRHLRKHAKKEDDKKKSESQAMTKRVKKAEKKVEDLKTKIATMDTAPKQQTGKPWASAGRLVLVG